jgi:hypothetical protein
MNEDQKLARIFGVLFIVTFITSIAALALFQPVLDDPAGYIAGGGKDSQIYLGAFLELLLIISNVGTAVVLYPIARRQNEALAIGYVAARIIECVFIAAGIIFVLGASSACGTTFQARTMLPLRWLRSRTGRSCSAPASSFHGGTV